MTVWSAMWTHTGLLAKESQNDLNVIGHVKVHCTVWPWCEWQCLLTLDCSAKPVMMTMMWSAMWQLASSGTGRQLIGAAPSVTAVWVREPISSQDIRRIWPMQSMNSLGLENKQTKMYNFIVFLVWMSCSAEEHMQLSWKVQYWNTTIWGTTLIKSMLIPSCQCVKRQTNVIFPHQIEWIPFSPTQQK